MMLMGKKETLHLWVVISTLIISIQICSTNNSTFTNVTETPLSRNCTPTGAALNQNETDFLPPYGNVWNSSSGNSSVVTTENPRNITASTSLINPENVSQNGNLTSYIPTTRPSKHTEGTLSPPSSLQNGTGNSSVFLEHQTCTSVEEYCNSTSDCDGMLQKQTFQIVNQELEMPKENIVFTFGTEGNNLVNLTFNLKKDAAAASRALKRLATEGLIDLLCVDFYVMLEDKTWVPVPSNYSICGIRQELLNQPCSKPEYCYKKDGTCHIKPVYQEFDFSFGIVMGVTFLLMVAILVFLCIYCSRSLWYGKTPYSGKSTLDLWQWTRP